MSQRVVLNAEVLNALDEMLKRYAEGEDWESLITELVEKKIAQKMSVIIMSKTSEKIVPALLKFRVSNREEDTITYSYFSLKYSPIPMKMSAIASPPIPTTMITGDAKAKLKINNRETELNIKYIAIGPATENFTAGKREVIGTILEILDMKTNEIKPLLVIMKHDSPIVKQQEIDISKVMLYLDLDPNDPYKTLSNLVYWFAPEIYGMEDIKVALLLVATGADERFRRYTPHGLMIGEPGTAKSWLASRLCEVWPRCIEVDAGHSTVTSLIAAYDVTTKEFQLGPFALMDGTPEDYGIVIINEAQNLKEVSRLRGALEDQKVDVEKAGKSMPQTTRCGVIFVCNPVTDVWNPALGIDNFPKEFRNIGLLSRIDLIMVTAIPRDLTVFEKVAKTVMRRVSCKVDQPAIECIYTWLEHVRKIRPRLTDEVENYIVEVAKELHQKATEVGLAFVPRDVEKLARLSVTIARLCGSFEVTKAHVDIAKMLLESLFQRLNIKPYEILAFKFGSLSERKLVTLVMEIIRSECYDQPCDIKEVVDKLREILEHNPELMKSVEKIVGNSLYSWVKDKAIPILESDGLVYKPYIDKVQWAARV